MKIKRHGDIIASLPFKIFLTQLDDRTLYWVHPGKREEDFQEDMLGFRAEVKDLAPGGIENALYTYLDRQGYLNIESLVTDEFRADVACVRARLVEKD